MRRHGRSVGVGCHRAEQSGLECNIKRGTGTGAAHPVCLFFWGATRSQPLTERKSPPCPPNQPARSTYVAIGTIRTGESNSVRPHHGYVPRQGNARTTGVAGQGPVHPAGSQGQAMSHPFLWAHAAGPLRHGSYRWASVTAASHGRVALAPRSRIR